MIQTLNMNDNAPKNQLRLFFRSLSKRDTCLNALHSTSIGMDFGGSLLTTWAYSVEMSRKHDINSSLFHGVIISVYSFPILFLDGYIGQQQQRQRQSRKKKNRTFYLAVASQTVALLGSSFYACDFSPILIIFGRIWQGFLLLKFNRTFPVGIRADAGFECGLEVSYGLGIVISSLFIGFTRNLDFCIGVNGGKIHIQYGNLSALNGLLTIVLLKMFTVATFHKLKIIKLTSNFFRDTKKNYGSYAKHYKVKARNYQALQKKCTKSVLTRPELSWVEKLHLAVMKESNSSIIAQTRELLYIGFLSQFSIALTLLVWIIILGQKFSFREDVTNCFLVGTFGLTYSISNSAFLFGFVMPSKLSNSLVCLSYPFLFIGALTSVHYLSLSKAAEMTFCGSCFAMAAILKSSTRQKYVQIISMDQLFSCQKLTRFDFYRIHSILNNMAVICAAMTSGYFWKYRCWFYIGYGTFSIIAVGIFVIKLKKKRHNSSTFNCKIQL